jgi:hypothetical protein
MDNDNERDEQETSQISASALPSTPKRCKQTQEPLNDIKITFDSSMITSKTTIDTTQTTQPEDKHFIEDATVDEVFKLFSSAPPALTPDSSV